MKDKMATNSINEIHKEDETIRIRLPRKQLHFSRNFLMVEVRDLMIRKWQNLLTVRFLMR